MSVSSEQNNEALVLDGKRLLRWFLR